MCAWVPGRGKAAEAAGAVCVGVNGIHGALCAWAPWECTSSALPLVEPGTWSCSGIAFLGLRSELIIWPKNKYLRTIVMHKSTH